MPFKNEKKVEEDNEPSVKISETFGVSTFGGGSSSDTRPSVVALSPVDNGSSSKDISRPEQNIHLKDSAPTSPCQTTTMTDNIALRRYRHISIASVRTMRRNRRRFRIRIFGQWVKLQVGTLFTQAYQKLHQRIQNQLILAQQDQNAVQSTRQPVAVSTQTLCTVATQTDLTDSREKLKGQDGHSKYTKYSEVIVNESYRKIANPFTSKMRNEKKKEFEKKKLEKEQKPKFGNSSYAPKKHVKSNSRRASLMQSKSKYSLKSESSPPKKYTTTRMSRYILNVPFDTLATSTTPTPTPTIQKSIIPPNVMIPSGKPLDSFLPLARDPITPPLLSPQIPETINNKDNEGIVTNTKSITKNSKQPPLNKDVSEKDTDLADGNSSETLSIKNKQKSNESTPGKVTRTKKKGESKNELSKLEKDKSIITRKYKKTNDKLSEESSSDFEIDKTIANSIQTKPSTPKVTRKNVSPGYYSAIFSSDEELLSPSSNFGKTARENKTAEIYTANPSSDKEINGDETISLESKSILVTTPPTPGNKKERSSLNVAQPLVTFSSEKSIKTASISPVKTAQTSPVKTAQTSSVKTASISPVEASKPNKDQKSKEMNEFDVQQTTFTIPTAPITNSTSTNSVTDEQNLTAVFLSTPFAPIKTYGVDGTPEKVQMDISPEIPKVQMDISPEKPKVQMDISPVKPKIQVDIFHEKPKIPMVISPETPKVQMVISPETPKVQMDISPEKSKVQLDATANRDDSLNMIAAAMPKSTPTFQFQNQQPQTFTDDSSQPTNGNLFQGLQQIPENSISSGSTSLPPTSLNFTIDFASTGNFTFSNSQFSNASSSNLNIQNIQRKIAAPRRKKK